MWYSTQLVITWLVHWFMDSMALMICKDIIVHHYCSLVVHLEKLGGGGLLVVHVVPHQVLVLVRQQQGHLHTIKAQIFKAFSTLVLTATRSSAKCCSS